MSPTRFLVPALALATTAIATMPGCSSSSSPTPRVALFAQLGASVDHPQDVCKQTFGDWVTVGSIGDNKLPGASTAPVNDGDSDQGHHISVTACSVTGDNGGFLVNVSVTVQGVGAFTVNGHFNAGTTNTGIQAVFSRGDTGTFTESDCTADFKRDGNDAPEMGVAGGRVWATVYCPNETLQAQGRVCKGQAEFRFENCSGS
jgi:hypothetical protein